MAEAHSAVAFSFTVSHEGVHVNFDHEVLCLVWDSGIRSWRKRLQRFRNNVKNGVYPASLQSLFITITIITGLTLAGIDVSSGKIACLQQHFFRYFVGPAAAYILSCSVFGFLCWWAIILAMQYMLKILLMYKGWMYEARGRGARISLKTKLWIVLVKILSGRKPMLYSFQASLPRLPVPSVKDTLQRYLRSVRPLLDDDKYNRMVKLAEEFENGIARKLQRYLLLKSWWASNYVSDWWEEYVYLRGRSPLMVNSNFYGIDAILVHPTNIQAARAASIIHSCFLFRRTIERQELEPIMVQGTVPLCSWQYERMFNTTRIPGIETDKLMHLNDSTHITVYYRGRYYKVFAYNRGTLLTPCEFEWQIQKILDDQDSRPEKGEQHLAALTAADRATWAKARIQYFSRGTNRTSIDAIERAAFCVILEDEDLNYDPEDPSKLNHFARLLLHGKGYDRWFDKSFNLVVGKNGRVGINAEHSWADAPVMGHMWEFSLASDLDRYKEDGHCIGQLTFDPPLPIRLKWDLSAECLELIEQSIHSSFALLSDVDLYILAHQAYGKGLMKTCRISPDAFIQMALQLAYYRDSGKFNLTYEASMTRLFREGRTETVRPCTVESSAWVKSMESKETTAEEKIALLRKACQVHQRAYQDAMCGKGIDRHLFCLYVVCRYLEVDSPFLKEVLSEPWRLSTSQTPHGQTTKLDLAKNPNCISAGGGFGPVADDGYGVSYIIAGEDLLFFHISSKKSSPETDSYRFSRQIERSLADMKILFQSVKKPETKKK
uniref:carnitine O-palmitoyltransferase n=1 Tax=Scolopendra viridis TaxID=118503 RepID=A0A4D5RA50_SCOVI